MAIKKINDEPKLSAFPEEVDENGLKIYGETSYEDQIAALSHYLHTTDFEGTQIEVQERRNELMALIREFLEYKDRLDDFTDEEIAYAADNPLEFDMFREFFKVPFPDPQQPNFTFIDLFAGMGGFRLAMQAKAKVAKKYAYLALDDKYKTEAFCIDNVLTPHKWFKEKAISEEEIRAANKLIEDLGLDINDDTLPF